MPTKRKKNSTKPAKVRKTIHGGSSYRELPAPVYSVKHGGALKKIHGGAAFRFNTLPQDKVDALKVKYAGVAHPDFVDQYADILNDRPRMSGWRGSIPSSEWYPEEKAAYLRDGQPKSKADIARIMGTYGNARDY